MWTILAQEVPNALAGNAGWAGAGLLGVILGWLLFWHLPKKDKQLEDVIRKKDDQFEQMVKDIADEREKERETRHGVANASQEFINKMAVTFTATLEGIRQQHKEDAERDRAAFDVRNQRIEQAILLQTEQLKAALATVCRFQHLAHPPGGK